MQNNKTIWITGASSGIGEASAYQFAKEKARLILTSTREDKLTEVQQKCIRLGAQCQVLPYDLSDLENIDKLTDKAVEALSLIHI